MSSAPPVPPPSGARPPWRAVTRHWWLWLVLAAAVLAGLWLLGGREWISFSTLLARVNRPLALVAMAVLPIFGFPISAVYLAIGALFGPWVGGLVVAAVTICHQFGTHLLAQTFLRERIEHWHDYWVARLPWLPAGENAALTALIVITPGPPYLVRNALLVLAEVPLRHRLGLAVPLYVIRSYVTLFLGALSQDPSPRTFALAGVVLAVKLTVGFLLFQRLRRRPGQAQLTRR